MMAWQRTAIALIGFGFAIVQYFGRFEDMPGARPARFPDAPRYLGLALILCGVLALIVAIAQYLWMAHYLRSGSFAAIASIAEMPRARAQMPVLAVAGVLLAIGVFAFLAVLTRLA
jgi:putative membrane protein